jgi:hypothetical protein
MTFSTQIAVTIFVPLAVGAFFAFLTAWVAGRNASKNAERQNDLAAKMKLADFRQGWINQLRDSLAEFESLAVSWDYDPPEKNTQLHRLAVKIRLSMNPKDNNYEKLSTMLDALMKDADPQASAATAEELTRISQDVLKKEWEVLKRDLRYTTRDAA